MIRLLTCAALFLATLTFRSAAALVLVDYRSEKGVCFTGTVDTTTNTMTLETWHVASGSWFLGMNLVGQDGLPGSLDDPAVEFVAWSGGTAVPEVTGSLNPTFDIPDDWDHTLGSGATGGNWFFVAKSQTPDLPWEIPAGADGEFLPGTRMSWGGKSNGTTWSPFGLFRVGIAFSDEDGNLYLGQDDHGAGSASVGSVAVLIPEPTASALLLLVWAGSLRRRRV